MGKYFMGNTDLAGMEREMMRTGRTPPPTAGGAKLCRLRYSPTDVSCRRCRGERRQPCPSEVSELETGALSYQELVRRCFQNDSSSVLWERIKRETERVPAFSWAPEHRTRLGRYLRRAGHPGGEGISPSTLAVLYLLTAKGTLWQRTEISLKKGTFSLSPFFEQEMGLQETVLYRTARGIQRRRTAVSPEDLANEDLVEADTLRHIVNAGLIERYGRYVLMMREEEALI